MKLTEQIGRYLNKEATKGDKKAIEEWIQENPENEQDKLLLESLWNSHSSSSKKIPPVTFIERLRYRMHQNVIINSKPDKTNYWRIAAAIVFFISIGTVIGWMMKSDLYQGEVIVKTNKGQKSEAVLPDGTHVWLGSNTTLSYNLSEWSKNRLVTCDGEVYFEVEHDDSNPFIVDADGAYVKVLGTKFNVRNYKDEGILYTTLTEGKVEVVESESNSSRVLQPGEQYILNRKNGMTEVVTVDVNVVKEWKDGILVFESVSFLELTGRLGKYYDVNFTYDKDQFTDIHYTGTFDDLTLNQVLDIMRMTLPFRYEIANENVKLEKIE